MTYRGHIENGLVVLDTGVRLPDGTQVRVDVVEQPTEPPREARNLRNKPIPREELAQLLKDHPAPPEFWNDPINPGEP